MHAPITPTELSPEELQARLAAIVSSSDDAIISKDLNGIVQSWNGAAVRIFGYSEEEMIGKSITVLFPKDRLQEESQILERLHGGERVDHFQTVRLRKDGRPINVSVTISPVIDAHGRIIGASKVARDITASTALEGMYKAIISSSDDAIISKDLNGIVQSWNAAATRMFGYTEAEMIGKSITTLFPEDRLEEEPKILAQLRRGERVDHFETIRVRKDGQPIDVSVTISPVKDAAGNVIGVSKVARDITAIKRHMREREALLARETAARAEAERVGRMKDEFLSTLSHELRTPLTAILGWASVMRESAARGVKIDLADGLATIERNARAQSQLVEELLDMSRIVNGKLRLDLRPVDLPSLIADGIESLRPAAEGRKVRLTHALDPKAGPIIADPDRVQQVLWNLLTNAIKFTPAGGRVQVLLQRVNSHVEITVADTGRGIAGEFLPQLFTRFAQEEGSTARQHGGLGLGLALVKALVELHGGTVAAHSPGADQGSTFVVCLPLAAAMPARNQPAATENNAAVPSELPRLDGYRVLIVDDEPDARALIKQILDQCYADVLTAASADEAVATLRRARPHLLLSDIGMPGKDGYDLIREVRALSREEGGDTPAVAITAFARSDDRRRALMAGFQMHLPKPIEPAELLAIVSSQNAAHRRAAR